MGNLWDYLDIEHHNANLGAGCSSHEGFNPRSAGYTGSPQCAHPTNLMRAIEVAGNIFTQCSGCGKITGLGLTVEEGARINSALDDAPQSIDFPENDIETPDREC